MEITLYTLPTCGICKVMGMKMREKGIHFKEEPFEKIMNVIHTDHAPALQIITDNGEIITYNSPKQIADWINQQ